MKAQLIKKYLSRSIVAILSATLVTSCAYDDGYNNTYGSTSPRSSSSNDPTVPLLIGAAAIGAIALAKRHNDKKRHRHYDHHRNHHYNHHRGHHDRHRYGHGSRSTCPQRPHYRDYSNHRGHNNHGNHNSHHRNHDRHRNRHHLVTTTKPKNSHGFNNIYSPRERH